MDILTFLSKAIESLAWPGVIIVALFLFRTPISSLLDAIKEAKLKIAKKKGGLTIEGELNTVREKLEKAPSKALPEPVKKLAATSPTQAIETSWRDLEQSATATMSVATHMSPLKIADMLLDRKILNENEAEAFYKLYEIKSEATKPESAFTTDVSSAATYSSLAYTLSEKIKKRET